MNRGGQGGAVEAGVWKDIEFVLASSLADRKRAIELAEELEAGIPVERTQRELLGIGDATFAVLFSELSDRRSRASPRAAARDTSWMADTDFCYLDARATGVDGRPGTFLTAAKLLPAIASASIRLAPFHPCQFDALAAIEDPFEIAAELVDIDLAAAGIGPLRQLRAFMEACRLLGKTVGYELSACVAPHSRVALDFPESFAWIKLAADRRTVEPGGHPYDRAARAATAGRVAAIVALVKERTGFPMFSRAKAGPVDTSDAGTDSLGTGLKERSFTTRAYYEAIRSLIAEGFWPLPAQAADGLGLPEFARFDDETGAPVYLCRNERGDDASARSSGVVTPYALYDGLPPNRAPGRERLPTVNAEALGLLASVFPYWRELAGFDFVCMDGLDHVLDSTLDDQGTLPASDRPTPAILAAVIAKAREGNAPSIGAFAGRSGAETADFGAMGFDVLLGDDMLRGIDQAHLEDAFALYDRLAAAKDGAARNATVCFALDTHDSGDTRMWGTPLPALLGRERAALRHFVARFLSVGAGRRPLHETMGYQDLSHGLYAAGVSAAEMTWVGDVEAARRYVRIERVYAALKPFMARAAIAERRTAPGLAWWIARGGESGRAVVCVAALETADKTAPGRVEIPLGPSGNGRSAGLDLQGTSYDFTSDSGAPCSFRGTLVIDDLAVLGYRVFDLTSAFY